MFLRKNFVFISVLSWGNGVFCLEHFTEIELVANTYRFTDFLYTGVAPGTKREDVPKDGFDLYAVLLKKLLRKSNLFNAKMPTYGKNDGLRSDNLINNINAEVF